VNRRRGKESLEMRQWQNPRSVSLARMMKNVEDLEMVEHRVEGTNVARVIRWLILLMR